MSTAALYTLMHSRNEEGDEAGAFRVGKVILYRKMGVQPRPLPGEEIFISGEVSQMPHEP